MSVYNTRLWLFLEDYVYYQPRQPRVRAKDRPLQVIAVGPVRSATESLQHALIQLGYEHTYHGWDLLFEERHNMRGWAKLARRKFLGTANSGGDCDITAADFDELMGDAVAVCDIPASVFAAEMIRAYPDAKVIINTNPDLDRWHASAEKNVVAVNRSWFIYLMSWTMKDWFWAWTSCERYSLENPTSCREGCSPLFVGSCCPGFSGVWDRVSSTVPWSEVWYKRKAGCWSGRQRTDGSLCVLFSRNRYRMNRSLGLTTRWASREG